MNKYALIGVFIGLYVVASLADEGRGAFPIYTRTLRPREPRIVVVEPSPLPPTLAQEQRPREILTQRQLTAEQTRLEQLHAEKAREAEIGGYTHMYGTSDLYGGLHNR